MVVMVMIVGRHQIDPWNIAVMVVVMMVMIIIMVVMVMIILRELHPLFFRARGEASVVRDQRRPRVRNRLEKVAIA